MAKPSETKVTQAIGVPPPLERRPGKLALRVLDGDMAGQVLSVAKASVRCGRSRTADLSISHRSVSKQHFTLRATEGGAELRDLDSKNGLWLGERRVFHVGLTPGDVFTAGECRLELVDVGEVEVEVSASNHCGLLHGSSVVMRELFARIELIAPTPLDVLIEGETGTGKEMASRSIHALSTRADQPLVVLDCACLPETLADATLFGFRKGAFTGADSEQAGVFEQADGGTVFIDEIGELPLGQQTKLLRVLDRRELSRLGEPGKLRKVDVRIVAATNRNLIDEVAEGRFREDLLHRLSQETIVMPPLRERLQDTIALAELTIQEVAGERAVELGPDAHAAMLLHTWPGNVRELRNAVRRAVFVCRDGVIHASDLRLGQRDGAATRLGQALDQQGSYEDIHLEFDRVLLPGVLREHNGSISAAAARLGISRDRLRRRLVSLGLYG